MTTSASRSLSGAEETRLFLETLLANRPEGSHFLVWVQAGQAKKISRSFTHIDEAVAYIQSWNGQGSVYIGAGLADKPIANESVRYKKRDVTALPALWIDIDIADPLAHQKNHLPSSRDEALQILRQIDLKPTVLIDSGHGYQAWWVFTEPFSINDDEERAQAQQIAIAWNTMVQGFAKQHGWEVDSTHDLARVMRVPGVLNMKVPEHPVPVCIEEFASENRYELQTMLKTAEYWLSQLPDQPSGVSDLIEREAAVHDIATNLILDPKAYPPEAKWAALTANNGKVLKALHHTGTDRASMSEYDMTLACYAVRADWTDQEICDLLIHHRVYHRQTAKIARADYFARTIKRARELVAKDKEHAETYSKPVPTPIYQAAPVATVVSQPAPVEKPTKLSSAILGDDDDEPAWEPNEADDTRTDAEVNGWITDEGEVAAPPMAVYDGAPTTAPDVPPSREPSDIGPSYSTLTAIAPQRIEAMAFLNQALGPDIQVKEVRYLVGASAGTYQLLLRQGQQEYWFQIEAGEAAEFSSFKRAWFRATRQLREPIKAQEWAKVGTWLGLAAEVIDLGDDTTETVELREWFDAYLETHALNRTWRLESTTPPEMDGGFVKDGAIYVQIKDFHAYINNGGGGKVDRAALTKRMTVAGFDRSKQNFNQRNGRPTSRSVWRAPFKWAEPWLEEPTRS